MNSKVKMNASPIRNNDLWMKAFIFITVFNTFFVSICNRFPAGEAISIVVELMVVSIGLFSNRMRLYRNEFLTLSVLIVLCLCNCLFFGVEFTPYVLNFLLILLPMIIAGSLIDFNEYDDLIYRISCVYISILLIYMISNYTKTSTVYSDYIDYLGFAYYAIPPLLFIIHRLFEKRSYSSLVFTVAGLFYLVICGTRGPVVCVLTYIAYSVLSTANTGSIRRKLLVLFGVFICGIITLNSQSIARHLYPVFQSHGYSTRFLLFIMNELDVTDLTGREALSNKVLDSLSVHPLVGRGLMSDRSLFGDGNQGYSHNIILELLHSFGIPIGLFMMCGLFILIVSAYRSSKDRLCRNYIVIYTISSVLKLMFSSSFMQESALFILIGICFASLRRHSDNLTRPSNEC